ncbi:MAG: T9SS type A sorting domain-containing protein [Ignavibacteria bacterium]
MTTKTSKICPVFMALFITMLTGTSFSTTINVTVQNFSFSPANVNAVVGDTIKWNWSNGSHTTTCDGSNGTTRPSGATSWNAGLNNGSPSFKYVIRVAGNYHYVCEPHAPDMNGNITATPSAIITLTELVNSYELSQNYPNPFNPTTNIKFSIQNSSNVKLKIFNSVGMEVETLVNQTLNAGTYRVDWNAVNFPSGLYYYRIESSDFVQTRKMLLIK